MNSLLKNVLFFFATNSLSVRYFTFFPPIIFSIKYTINEHSLPFLIITSCSKRNNNHIKLSPELISKTIAGRYYQVNAITKSLEALNDKKRSILWVMATGTGKTRTVISLVDTLLRSGFVKRVFLFSP